MRIRIRLSIFVMADMIIFPVVLIKHIYSLELVWQEIKMFSDHKPAVLPSDWVTVGLIISKFQALVKFSE